jgi:ribosomal-protein-alanine N-acetyltransferase
MKTYKRALLLRRFFMRFFMANHSIAYIAPETERLILSPRVLADAEFCVGLATNPLVQRYGVFPQNRVGREDYLARFRAAAVEVNTENKSVFIIRRKVGYEPVGMIRIFRPAEGDAAEIDYMIDPQYQNKGYATEAVAAAIEFARDDMRLRSLRGGVHVRNGFSAGVLERNGFKQEAFVGICGWPIVIYGLTL